MIINQIKKFLRTRNSEAYINHLRSKGVKIGNNCLFFSPRSVEIDETRPSLITIGDNCQFNKHVELITHDWVSSVFINSGRSLLNSCGRITIGNNV